MMKQADINRSQSKPSSPRGHYHQKNHGKPRRFRQGNKKFSHESSHSSLTLSRPGRQKPIPLIKSKYKPEKKPSRIPFRPDCALCGKKIMESSSILEDPETAKPAHFDCVITQIKSRESLAEHQRLVYLGSGSFAVIESLDSNKKNSPFRIVRYTRDRQTSANIPDWRHNLAVTPRYIIRVEKTTLHIKEELEAADRMSIKPLDSLEFSLLEQDN